MTPKDIDAKILYRFVKSNYRLYPRKECWFKAYNILLRGYYNIIDEIKGYKVLGIKKNYKYPLKPTWVPKPNVHYKTQQTVLASHIAYAKNLNDQDILNKFGYYLINLDESDWIRSVYMPDGKKIKRKRKKTAKENIDELLSNPKNLLKAKRLLRKNELLKKNKFK